MDTLKRDLKIFGFVLLALAALIIYVDLAKSDTGWDQAPRIERGHSPNVRQVSLSSTTGTAIFSASFVRADGMCRNNGSTTIWVGTVTATLQNQYHTNIINGFPVLSSETFKLDGSFTGTWAGTCDVGIAACEVRCIDGLLP